MFKSVYKSSLTFDFLTVRKKKIVTVHDIDFFVFCFFFFICTIMFRMRQMLNYFVCIKKLIFCQRRGNINNGTSK